MKKTYSGFMYSYITKKGHENLVMASFGVTKTKSKKHFNYHNQGKLEPIKPFKRYEIQVSVIQEAQKGEE